MLCYSSNCFRVNAFYFFLHAIGYTRAVFCNGLLCVFFDSDTQRVVLSSYAERFRIYSLTL
jgi:hypothetical protein